MVYRCKNCSAELSFEKSICIQCGYDNSANTFESVLTEMLDLFGKEVFCKETAMIGIFKDLAPDLTDEGLMVKYLFEVDGPADLFRSLELAPLEAKLNYNRVIFRLTDKFISEEKAEEICTRFLNVAKNWIATDKRYHISAEFYINRSVDLTAQAKYKEAAAAGEKAVMLDPNNARSHGNLAVAYKRLGRLEEAKKESTVATNLDPNNARYHALLGSTLHALKQHVDAVAELRRAIEIDSRVAAYFNCLAHSLAMLGQFKTAIEEMKWATDIEPNNAVYHDALATLYFKCGENEKAALELHKAISIGPNEAIYHKHLSIVLSKMGFQEEADRQQKIALSLL